MEESNTFRALRDWLEQTRDEPLEAMDAFFDARVGEYEAHMSPWRAHYEWMAALLPQNARTLLDVGCGTGLELDAIFKRNPSLRVTGIDLSHEMLAALEKKHPDKALTLIAADYFLYEFGENRFDAAVSFETLHHVTKEQKTALFAKIARALVPGGAYLSCDYIAVSEAAEDLVFAECARRRARDGIAPDAFVHFDTPLTLSHEMQALQNAGFSTVECLGFLPGDDHTPMLRAIK